MKKFQKIQKIQFSTERYKLSCTCWQIVRINWNLSDQTIYWWVGEQWINVCVEEFFGVPCELFSDGSSEFIPDMTQAEVKTMKRVIEDNISQDGQLDTNNFHRAILIKRKTPDPSYNILAAEAQATY